VGSCRKKDNKLLREREVRVVVGGKRIRELRFDLGYKQRFFKCDYGCFSNNFSCQNKY
jgi:hypothetical protein